MAFRLPRHIDGMPSFGRILLWSLLTTMMFASLFVVQMWLQQVMNAGRLPYMEMLTNYSRNLFWGLTAPIVLWWTLRYPIEAPNRLRHLFIHAGFYIAFSLVHAVYRTGVYYFLDREDPTWLALQVYLSLAVNANLWMYLPVLAVGHILLGYQRARDRERQARQLQAELAQAELQVLKSQLHPHFLFNTLNSISALIQIDPKAADQMVVRLSALLRNTLENMGIQEVPLKQELEVLEDYLQIEQTRFHDRLRVRAEIQPEALDAIVPYLLLQPLAENAVRHGTSKLTGVGEIWVRAEKSGSELVISIADNGPGLPSNGQPKGVGLGNTKARLARLYGREQSLDLRNGESGGAVVTVRLPFRAAAPAALEQSRDLIEAPAS